MHAVFIYDLASDTPKRPDESRLPMTIPAPDATNEHRSTTEMRSVVGAWRRAFVIESTLEIGPRALLNELDESRGVVQFAGSMLLRTPSTCSSSQPSSSIYGVSSSSRTPVCSTSST